MPLSTSSFTTASIESVIRRTVLERFLRDTGVGDYGTATGGSTSTIIDTTKLQSSQYNPSSWGGAWGRISYDAGGAGATPEGEIRNITSDGYTPGNGKLTVTPVFSAAPASGDKYQLWRYIHPQRVLDTLDQVLTEDCYLPDWAVCTEVPDGDMEQNNTTDWSATNATVAKSTSEPLMWGKRYLTVATTSTDGYAYNTSPLKVIPGKKYHLSAVVRASAASTTAKLIAYDLTNSAVIDYRTTTSQTDVRLWMEVSVPATCNQVSIRLSNSENSVTSHWDEVAWFCLDAHDVALPWWVRNKQQVKAVFSAHAKWDDAGTSQWNPIPHGTPDFDRWDFVDRAVGRGQMRLVSRQGTPSKPVYIMGTRNETAFANENSDTKRVDANWLAACLNYRVFSQLKRMPNAGALDMGWINISFQEFQQDYERQRRKQAERFEEAWRGHDVDALIYRDDRRFIS